MRKSAWLFSTTMLSGALGAWLLGLTSAQAQSPPVGTFTPPLPAVDGFNNKFEVLGGAFGGHGLYGAAGSFTTPLGHSTGFQIDGLASVHDGHFAGGVGGHLFWRDPSQGLLGLYAAHTHYARFGGVHVNHAAVEFERYWGQWTLQGIVGVEGGNSGAGFQQTGESENEHNPVGILTNFDVATRFFDKINLNYYLNDNAMLTVGHRYVGGKHALALGGEWAVPLASNSMAAFFAEGRIGEGDYRALWAGLRFYNGQSDKTLIRRHREDDPVNWMPETLFGILNNGGSSLVCPGYPNYDPASNECG